MTLLSIRYSSGGAGLDFDLPDPLLTISGPPFLTACTALNISMDGRVEATENFTLLLNTSDDMVSIDGAEAEVIILNSDCESWLCMYTRALVGEKK